MPGDGGGARWRRVLRIFRPGVAQEVDEELAFHLDMRTSDYASTGLQSPEARAAAEHRFGDVTTVRDACRELGLRQERTSRWRRAVGELGLDIHRAARALMKRPAFTAVAALTLALGIGANTAIFSVVSAYLLRPLPLANADRLLVVAATSRGSDVAGNISYPNFVDLRARTNVFQDAVLFDAFSLSIRSDSGEGRLSYVEGVTGNYFRMLGVRTILGRGLTEEDEAGRLRDIVLTYAAWKKHFGGDPDIVGKPVRINGAPFTVVGVVAPGYDGLRQYILRVDGMMPITTVLALSSGGDAVLQQRRSSNFRVMALLKPDVSLSQALGALKVLGDQLRQTYPDDNPGLRFVAASELRSRPDIAVSGVMPWVAAVFLGLGGLVLVVGCVNVASLVMARAVAQRVEFGVRRALGATEGRVRRQIITETMMLAALGLICAMPVAIGALAWLATLRPATDTPTQVATALDWRMIVFSVFITLVAGLLAGLGPAWQSARSNLHDVLKEGGRSGGDGGRQRGRSALVVVQVAVSLVLLICAGLFVRSLSAASRLDLGFRNTRIVMLQTDVSMAMYPQARGVTFYRDLVAHTRTLPGVQAVALNREVPLGYTNRNVDVYFDHDIGVTDNHVNVLHSTVTPDYFTVLGYPLLQGRAFDRSDDSAAPRVAIVNDELARRYWPGKSAVGQQIRLEKDGALVTVVGIVKGGKYSFLTETPKPFLYLPFDQHYHPDMMLSVLTSGDPAAVVNPLRHVVHALDPDVTPFEIKTMAAHLHNGLWFLLLRMAATLAAAIGMLGLLQTAVGVYGVQSLRVTQQSRDTGIRVALGARPGQVIAAMLRRSMLLTGAGILIGALMALALARTLQALLVGVSGTDALTFATAITTLLAASCAAAWIPARRASRLDPTTAMRHDT